MDDKNDKKIQEILHQQGQGIADRAIQKMKEATNREVIEGIDVEGIDATDEITSKIAKEAEATKRAYEIIKSLRNNKNIQQNIDEISKGIAEQLYIKRHFPKNSVHQPYVDSIVKEELIKISSQVAKKITEQTMENMAKTERQRQTIEKGER